MFLVVNISMLISVRLLRCFALMLLSAILAISNCAWAQSSVTGVNTLGTTLPIGANGKVVMTVYDNGTDGYVGIGVTAPDTPLAIGVGNDRLGFYQPSNNVLAIQTLLDNVPFASYGTYGGGQNQLVLQPIVGNVGIGTTQPNGTLDISSRTGDGIVIYQQADNSETIQTYIDGHWADRKTYASGCCNVLLLEPDVGNVGIGTTTAPLAKLTISGSSSYSDQTGTLEVLDGSNPSKFIYMGFDDSLGFGFIQAMNYHVAWPNLVLEPNAGNVGVGVTDPSAPLDVNGGIRGNNSGTVAGSGCSPEGMLAYDMASHQPVYCSNGAVWTAVNSNAGFLSRTWHLVNNAKSGAPYYSNPWTNTYSYPADAVATCQYNSGSAVMTTLIQSSPGVNIAQLPCNTNSGSASACTTTVPVPHGESVQVYYGSCNAVGTLYILY